MKSRPVTLPEKDIPGALESQEAALSTSGYHHNKPEESEEHEEPEFTVGAAGAGPLLFMGFQGQRNWGFDLKNFHFLIPVSNAKTLTLRTSIDCPMPKVFQAALEFFRIQQGITIPSPILTYKGDMVDESRTLYTFPPKSFFIIHDGQVPQILVGHLGQPWQCSKCGVSGNIRRNLTRPTLSNQCKHTFWFEKNQKQVLGDTSGDRKGRNTKPLGCPTGHEGPAVDPPQPQPAKVPPQPAPSDVIQPRPVHHHQSSSPVLKGTLESSFSTSPLGAKRLVRSWSDTSLNMDPPTPASAMDPAITATKPSRAAKVKAKENFKKVTSDSQGEWDTDISGSDLNESDWSEKSGQDVSEENVSGQDSDDEQAEELVEVMIEEFDSYRDIQPGSKRVRGEYEYY